MAANKAIKYTVIILSVLVVLFAMPLVYFEYVHTWKYIAEFDEYEQDFENIVEYLLEEYPDEAKRWFSVSVTDSKGRNLYDPEINDLLNLPDDVRSSLETICDFGFPDKDSNLDTISISENRVTFGIVNGEYALVYSPDEIPKWVNDASEKESPFIKKINDNWYHVTKR